MGTDDKAAATAPAPVKVRTIALGETWSFPAKKGWSQVVRPGGSVENVMAKRGRCKFVPDRVGTYEANGHRVTVQ